MVVRGAAVRGFVGVQADARVRLCRPTALVLGMGAGCPAQMSARSTLAA